MGLLYCNWKQLLSLINTFIWVLLNCENFITVKVLYLRAIILNVLKFNLNYDKETYTWHFVAYFSTTARMIHQNYASTFLIFEWRFSFNPKASLSFNLKAR